jgi:hypothetical protein
MSAIRGIITTRTVLLHAPLIGYLFGPMFLLRCLVVVVSRKPTTFLSLLYPNPICSSARDISRN